MKAFRRAACVVLAAMSLVAAPAYPTAFSTDSSDLWYIVAESGWGMQLVQRGNTIFATLFVYDASGAPTWYVATILPTGVPLQWSGDLLATTGPWFGTVPFNPANVTATKVGTMTWTLQTVVGGLLTYVVNGVTVTKSVIRQTLVLDNFSGAYKGAFHATATGCSNPADNASGEFFGTIVVTQNGQSVSLSFIAENGATITAIGTLFQDGQFGAIGGTYTSSAGEAGNAGLFEINVQFNSLTSRLSFTSTNNGCQTTGYLGGIRSRP